MATAAQPPKAQRKMIRGTTFAGLSMSTEPRDDEMEHKKWLTPKII